LLLLVEKRLLLLIEEALVLHSVGRMLLELVYIVPLVLDLRDIDILLLGLDLIVVLAPVH
jgi:hypothetical protein